MLRETEAQNRSADVPVRPLFPCRWSADAPVRTLFPCRWSADAPVRTMSPSLHDPGDATAAASFRRLAPSSRRFSGGEPAHFLPDFPAPSGAAEMRFSG